MARSDSRERILDAAERLFAEKGVAAASLREIGGQAQANPGSIYFHWKTKAELVRDVFRRRLEPLDAERLRRLDAAERVGERAEREVEAREQLLFGQCRQCARERRTEALERRAVVASWVALLG